MPNATLPTPYSAAQFVLELGEREKVGFCRSVEGGGAKAEILTYRQVGQGAATYARQLAAKPKFEDIKLQVGMSMSATFYTWIEEFFRGGTGDNGEIIRKHGAIVSADYSFKERYRREFYDALISEVAIPKLDASDRNAAYMGVTIVPEAIEFKPGDEREIDREVFRPAQKLWTPNNFSFTVDGLPDTAFQRVTRVDGFTIKQQILEYHAGDGHGQGAQSHHLVHTGRGVIRVPGMIEFPNLSVYLPEVDAHPLIEHFTKHVLSPGGGGRGESRMTGELVFQGQDGEELCSISLDGMDIASVVPDRADSTSRDVKQVKVEFSCESMRFTYGSGQGSSAVR